MKKTAIIIGAGPAGLTAAYEFLKKTDIAPIIFEESDYHGGISRTVEYGGNRIDIGGHRFFSKDDRIIEWWNQVMPMLIRDRVSRIYYLKKFFDYPISLKFNTIKNLGFLRMSRLACGLMYSSIFKRKEESLEDFYINRFGKPLYQMFFENYTEKVWGKHPSQLSADWGAQRVKGLSLKTIVKDIAKKTFHKSNDLKQKDIETSLIEKFIYPKYGPGQLWDAVASDIKNVGGAIHLNSKVVKLHSENNKIISVDVECNGQIYNYLCDYVISSMPIKDLFSSFEGLNIPETVRKSASNLPYRDFIVIGLVVNDLKIKNHTNKKTFRDRVPDTWIYIQEADVKIGRLQIFNNWSPYMVKDFENTVSIGCEYFCTEGDNLWNMTEKDFIEMAVNELKKIEILDNEVDILDSIQIKVKKAYPAYYGSYGKIEDIKSFLNGISNLYCVGRNGQHRYNNMDHSMLTAMEAVDNILNNRVLKDNIWNVNTEETYHEEKHD